MFLPVEKTPDGRQCKVKDLSLAESCCLEVERAEAKMCKTRAFCDKLVNSQPLKGMKIICCLKMTAEEVVFIGCLTALGADVRCCPSSSLFVKDDIVAAIARDKASVFAWEGQTLQEYYWCINRALDFGPGAVPDLIIDGGDEFGRLIREGVKAEVRYGLTGELPDLSSGACERGRILSTMISGAVITDPKGFRKINKRLGEVPRNIIDVVDQLYSSQFDGCWLCLRTPFVKVTLPESMSDTLDDGHHGAVGSFSVGINVAVCGNNDIGKNIVIRLMQAGYRPFMTKIDSNCANWADKSSILFIAFDNLLPKADIILTANPEDIIRVDHMKKMKNGVFVGNISNFDNAIDMHGLKTYLGIRCTPVMPRIVKWIFPETGSSVMILNEGRSMNLDESIKLLAMLKSCSSVDLGAEPWDKKGTGTGTGTFGKMLRAWSNRFDEDGASSSSINPASESTKDQPEELIDMSIGGNIILIPGTEGMKWDIKGKFPHDWRTYSVILAFLIVSYVTASKVNVNLSF